MSGDTSQPKEVSAEDEYIYDQDKLEHSYDDLPENFENYNEDSEEKAVYSLDQEYEESYQDENPDDKYISDESNQIIQEDESHLDNQQQGSPDLNENTEEDLDDSDLFDNTQINEQSENFLLDQDIDSELDELPAEAFEDTNEQEDHELSDISYENSENENDELYIDENEENHNSEFDELPAESFDSEEEQYIEENSEESEQTQEVIQEEIVEEIPEEPEQPKFILEEVKSEIHIPVNLENAANYLMSLPILGEVVKEKYLLNIKKETDDVKLRAIRVATQKEIIAGFKEERQPYIITHFTSQDNLCTVDKTCLHKNFKSVYYEVSNPVTNKNVMLTSHMFHNMTRHHMVYFNEPLLNLGNSPQGFFDSYLPCADLMNVLKNSNVTDDVIEELEAVREKIEYLEYERFAAVRGNVQYDMSVFDQTDYEKENNIIPFYSMLRTMVDWGAEDIHIKAGFRPMGVLGGDVKPCPSFPDFLTPERTKYYSNYLMTPSQQQQFEETLEMDNSFYVPGVARFRCNMYHSQGAVGLVFRVIPTKIRPVEVLGVPLILKKLVFERLGLVLVTGQTGSGKTTTLAAIVEFCNVNRAIHILTLENPVEYVYESKKSVFTQRAIEIDSLSFPMAMRGALRQKPDIILIGEMRDPDTIMAGLKAAETGHLVMSTLHTNDAVQTINRIVNTFPPHEQETIRVQVGSTIKACVAQRLIPRFDKPGRVCSIEVMLVTPNARGQNTRGYIIRNEVPELYKVVATSDYDGMQSMNMALFEHYKNGVITPDDALSYSDNPDEITRWMREDMGLGA